jgi:hypothetical protein
MTDFARQITAFAFLVILTTASLASVGCSSTPLCECPAFPAVTTVTVPAAQSSAIASVYADLPCMASSDSAGNVVVHGSGAGTCNVLVQLNDNARYTFSVEFRTMRSSSGNCSCEMTSAVDASVPSLVDGSAE